MESNSRHLTSKTKISGFFSNFPLKRFKKEQNLIASGENPRGIYYLKKGYVRMFSYNKSGKEATIHIFVPGSFFPMTWGLAKIDNSYYYSALTTVETLFAPRVKVVKFLKNNPEILLTLFKRLLFGLDNLAKRIEQMTFGSAKTRTASILVYLARHFGKRKGKATVFSHKFTHYDIATLAGITREHVSLEIEELEKKGIVAYSSHFLVIKSINRLKKLVL